MTMVDGASAYISDWTNALEHRGKAFSMFDQHLHFQLLHVEYKISLKIIL